MKRDFSKEIIFQRSSYTSQAGRRSFNRLSRETSKSPTCAPFSDRRVGARRGSSFNRQRRGPALGNRRDGTEYQNAGGAQGSKSRRQPLRLAYRPGAARGFASL